MLKINGQTIDQLSIDECFTERNHFLLYIRCLCIALQRNIIDLLNERNVTVSYIEQFSRCTKLQWYDRYFNVLQICMQLGVNVEFIGCHIGQSGYFIEYI